MPQVWGLPDVDTGELVLYPREDPPLIQVTPDVAALWHEVQVRRCMQQIEYSEKACMPPSDQREMVRKHPILRCVTAEHAGVFW